MLSGIGTEAWKGLWESARRYSESHAYSGGETFPVVREGAICVLCQQALSADAARRLHSFEEFVKSDVQQRADKAGRDLSDAVEGLRALNLPKSVRQAVHDARLLDLPEGEAIRRFLVGAKLRRRYLLRQVEKGGRLGRPTLPGRPELGAVLGAISDEARRLRQASRTTERVEMERELAELKAREMLSPHLEAARGEIERLRRVAELDAALADCKTQPVTLKAREAATSVITDRLRSNFQSNLLAIGFTESPVEVRLGAGEYGQHPYEMKLMARPEVPPEDVLSEGERTCVALAGLLAELETTGNRSALVLDDPVSSLDHQYRKRVAERLVREARERQVVVFTHDIVFLYLLRKYQSELGVPASEVSLERGYKKDHGRATEGPPWVAMLVNDRIKRLRAELLEARTILREGNRAEYERRARAIYSHLRMSWERAIEEVLLNQTVVRFGDSVQTKRLAKLTDISDEDVEQVTKEMSRCSDFEHDESGAAYAGVPEPDVVDSDIRTLEEWVKNLRRNRGRS